MEFCSNVVESDDYVAMRVSTAVSGIFLGTTETAETQRN